jgi:hypothetical protein
MEYLSEVAIRNELVVINLAHRLKSSPTDASVCKIMGEFEDYKSYCEEEHARVLVQKKKSIEFNEALRIKIENQGIKKGLIKVRNTIENSKKTIKDSEDNIAHIRSVELTISYTKERFGAMVLMMINNVLAMPSFSSYTDGYRDEFASLAQENIFKYHHNFDYMKLSTRKESNGKPVKAFAYISQIIFNSFVKEINTANKNKRIADRMIPHDNSTMDMFFGREENISSHDPFAITEKEVLTIDLSSEENEDETYILSLIEKLIIEEETLSNIKFKKYIITHKGLVTTIDFIGKLSKIVDGSDYEFKKLIKEETKDEKMSYIEDWMDSPLETKQPIVETESTIDMSYEDIIVLKDITTMIPNTFEDESWLDGV